MRGWGSVAYGLAILADLAFLRVLVTDYQSPDIGCMVSLGLLLTMLLVAPWLRRFEHRRRHDDDGGDTW